MVVIRFTGRAPTRRKTQREVRRTPMVLEQLEDRCLLSMGPAAPLAPHDQMAPTYVVYHHRPGITPFVGPSGYGFSPTQMRAAYAVDQVIFQSGGKPVTGDGTGETIAIVDAYDDPSAANDLAFFDNAWSLPAANFTKIGIDASGNASTTKFPSANAGWALEISLDIEWAHAIAPAAKLILVEANSASGTDLVRAVQYAATTGAAQVVSMSWGGQDFAGEQSYDPVFNVPGVTFVASSGDNGNISHRGGGPIWPSVSDNVVAAGGTSLFLNTDNSWKSESGWSGSGGGVSQFEPAPTYQQGLKIYSGDPPANGMRVVPDISWDADPATGVPVYDTFGQNGWLEVGGTSAAAPQLSALFAIADQGRALHGLAPLNGPADTLPDLYKAPATDYHDITTGNNGYPAGPGFDEVTGIGTPIATQLMPDLGAPLQQQILTTVTISPSNPTVGDGVQLQFTATGYDQFGYPMSPQPSLSWQLGIGGQGSINSSTGLYKAPASGTGTDVVNVSASEGGVTVSNSTNVTFEPAPAITGPTANPNPTFGTTTTLSAGLADPYGTLNYTWSVISGPSGAKTPTLQPASGTATPPTTVTSTATFFAAGNYVFRLTATDPQNLTASSDVSVTVNQTLTSIQVAPGSATLQDGQQQQFTATADDQFGNPLTNQPPMTWSLASGGQGTINSTGLYTAPSSGSGTDTVQATATVNGTTLTGTASASYSAGLAITSLTADPNPVTSGNTTTLTAQVVDGAASLINFNWSVTAPAGAPQPEISPQSGTASTGTLTASVTFYASGTYVFQLDVSDFTGQSASDTLSVDVTSQGIAITSLSANPNPVTGTTTTLTAAVTDAFWGDVAFTWSVLSGPSGIAPPEISPESGTAPTGTLTATATFNGPGTYVFQLSVSDASGASTSDTVSVDVIAQGPAITSLTANPNPVVGATGTLDAQVTDSYWSTITYNWVVVSTPQGAPPPTFMPQSGSASTGALSTTTTYYAPGAYVFELDVQDPGGLTASAQVSVTVNAATPTIDLTANPSTVTGTTTSLSGSITDANELSPDFQYSWSAPSIPSGAAPPSFTNPSGHTTNNPITSVATFAAAGNYQLALTITDTWGIRTSQTVNVSVVQTLTTVTVTPPTVTLAQGSTQQFTAQAFDQFHHALTPPPSFTWSVASGPGTITSTGLYSATSLGTAVVQATTTVNGVTVSGTAQVTVTAQPPVISFIGANPNPVTGTTTTLTVTASDPSGGTLSYAWSVVSQPGGVQAPTFDSSTSAVTGVTFYGVGSYTFQVVVTSDTTGASTTATVRVTVLQTLTRVTVTPSLASVPRGGMLQLTAAAFDQFGNRMLAIFNWSLVSGPGSVSATGLYHAPTLVTGKAVIKATTTVGGVTQSGTATIVVV
jgi:hypothetical protein